MFNHSIYFFIVKIDEEVKIYYLGYEDQEISFYEK